MNSKNVTEETLTFYYYNDGLSLAERQQVTNMLATDAELGERYRNLCQQMEQFADAELHKPRSDMVERWHDSIKRAALQDAPAKAKPTLHTGSFFWGVAVTAALAVGIGIGTLMPGGDSNEPSLVEVPTANANSASAFVRGLQIHLRESEEGLSRFTNTQSQDNIDLIMHIIEQNRLFERTAVQNDEQRIARVLRAFELVLIELAAEDTTPEEAQKLRAKLMFELNIVLTKISRDSSDERQSI